MSTVKRVNLDFPVLSSVHEALLDVDMNLLCRDWLEEQFKAWHCPDCRSHGYKGNALYEPEGGLVLLVSCGHCMREYKSKPWENK